jgi:acylphosphatase
MTVDRPANEPQTRRYLFFGRVQGVGFRFTTAHLAEDCDVQGYVRNRPDGSVELVAHGTQADIEQLLARLDEHFAGHIERRTEEDCSPKEPFAGFEVRR